MADQLDSELERFDHWIGGMMAALSPARQREASNRIASMVRGRQAKRIAAQKNPDGSAFEEKKPQDGPVLIARTIKFLYPSGGSGDARVVVMKRWRKDGGLLTGFDAEAGALRSFNPAKIIRWLPVTAAEQNKRAGKPRRRTVREQQMFRKLRTYRFLRKSADATGAEVGFAGVAAGIAGIHQSGGFDNVTDDGPRIRYPKRQLLGFTGEEETAILDIMAEMLEHADD